MLDLSVAVKLPFHYKGHLPPRHPLLTIFASPIIYWECNWVQEDTNQAGSNAGLPLLRVRTGIMAMFMARFCLLKLVKAHCRMLPLMLCFWNNLPPCFSVLIPPRQYYRRLVSKEHGHTGPLSAGCHLISPSAVPPPWTSLTSDTRESWTRYPWKGNTGKRWVLRLSLENRKNLSLNVADQQHH